MRILLATLVLMAFVVSCAAVEPPSVQFDYCPDCPVLVMGDSDSPEWQRLDNSTEFISDIMVLIGCHYGYETDAITPEFGLRDKGNGPLLNNDEHLALVHPTDGIERGACYEMTVRHIIKAGERPPPAPTSVHYFGVIEVKSLAQQDWERWTKRQ